MDLQKTRQISIFARALGGGRSSKVQGPCQIKSCGRNEPNSKYFKLATFSPEKRNVIMSGDFNLNESSVVCQKCYSKLKRQPDVKKAFQPKKQKLDRPKCIIPDCPLDSEHNYGGTKLEFLECFEALFDYSSSDKNIPTIIPLCKVHYMELYHFFNKCTICNSRVASKNTRHCQEPGLLSTYWSELFPGENIHIKKDDKICKDCYFAFQKLKKQNTGASSDMKLKTFLNDHSPVNCIEHKTALECALHCTQSLLASVLLNGYVILLPELFSFFENSLMEYQTAHMATDSELPKKSTQWLLSFLMSKMSDHFLCHSYKSSKKHGIMIYRKGCNLLNVLHLTAYRQYNLVRQQKESVENTQLSNNSDRDDSFSGVVLKDAYHTALYLNNKIYSMNLKFTEWLKKCDDLSDVKFFDMIEQIDPVVWNFFTVLSLNKSKLSAFQKSFDFDWETHIYLGNLTITVEDCFETNAHNMCSYVYAESILSFTSVTAHRAN